MKIQMMTTTKALTMNKVSLKILHLNTQSIIPDTKKIQIDSLISKHKPCIISFNETFLKPNLNFEMEGFNLVRADRTNQRGGGVLLGIQNNIIGEPIPINHLLKDDYAAGFLIKATNNMNIAVFTIYSPPLIPMNKDLFNFIVSNFKYFIITGDQC